MLTDSTNLVFFPKFNETTELETPSTYREIFTKPQFQPCFQFCIKIDGNKRRFLVVFQLFKTA